MTGVCGGGMGKSSGFAAAFSHPYINRHRVIPTEGRNLLVITNYFISIFGSKNILFCSKNTFLQKSAIFVSRKTTKEMEKL